MSATRASRTSSASRRVTCGGCAKPTRPVRRERERVAGARRAQLPAPLPTPGDRVRARAVRAFLSDGYKIIDNLDVLLAALDGVRQTGFRSR